MAKQNSPLVLGTERIGKLLTQYAIPAIIAMTASSLYNMADSIFIGHGVGPLAISGLALTFPLMNLAAAFGSLVGVGASTLVSVKLGQKDYDGANKVLGNVLVLNVLLGLAFTFAFLFMLDPILYFFGASEHTIAYARDYMEIILYGNVITHMYLGLNAVLRSSGFPKLAMYATLASVVINCVLNPIFIFGFDWGIKGSAWATIISQVISLTGQFIHFSRPTQLLHFKKGIYKLRKEIVKGILYIGMSPFLMNLCSCLIVILINRGLKEHGGDMAIGAYGIINRLLTLYVMIVLGLTMGMQPIVGYNFGAQKIDRVKQTLRLGIISGVVITSSGFIICEFFPHAVSALFTDSDELIDLAVDGIRLAVLMFPFVGAQIVIGNFFQSIGKAKISIFLSLTRQLLYLLPCLLLFPNWWGLEGIWISMPVSDALAFITAVVSLMIYIKKVSKQHPETVAE